MTELTFSIFQAAARAESVDARLNWLDMAAERAAESGADVLACPELTLGGFGAPENLADVARPRDGEYAERVGEIAFLHEISIVFGYPEVADGHYYNAAMFVDAKGEMRAAQRKSHLLPQDATAGVSPGAGLALFDCCGWKIALLIGRDLEFPEVARHAALGGADLLVAPAALEASQGIVADKMVPVRALENGVYVAYANWAGGAADAPFYGGSCIIAPDGTAEAEAGKATTILMATLQKSRLGLARTRAPYLRDRRGPDD